MLAAVLLALPAKADTAECAKAVKEKSPYVLAACRPVAEKGDTVAQFYTGLLYANGLGVPPNLMEAVRWYRLAAEKGDPFAQTNLGVLYVEGRLPKDPREALRLFRLAAAQGFPAAQRNLGNLYRDGTAVPQSYAEAARWYQLAAEGGNLDAQYNLAVLYQAGKGVQQDFVRAYQWFSLAAVSMPEAQDGLAALVKKMNAKQIEQGQTLARNWRPRVPARKKR